MKKYICILAGAALLAACEQKTETVAPAAPAEKKAVVAAPKIEVIPESKINDAYERVLAGEARGCEVGCEVGMRLDRPLRDEELGRDLAARLRVRAELAVGLAAGEPLQHFTLAPGTWWIYARAWDTSDPNSQWYWNVPSNADTILLSSRTGQRRPRY